MAEKKAISFIEKSSNEDAEAYKSNYGAHKEGITKEEMAEYYSNWARSGKYEMDLSSDRYRGPILGAGAVAEIYASPGTDRSTVRILDVAAGTGRLGEELAKHGFKNMDALDPSAGMLEAARKKNLYTNYICEFFTEERSSIQNKSYDVLVIAGGMGEGHIPCGSLREMARIVKPGGFVCVVMRKEYLQHVKDYKNTLEPLMKTMEDEGIWKIVSRTEVPKYSFDNDGVIFKFKIC